MKAALQIVYWEIARKNRLVFSALAVLLLFGGLVSILFPVEGSTLMVGLELGRLTLLAFLISLLISFAPFLLVESGEGWRMNSSITRWLTLPISTGWLVFAPLLAAALFIAVLVGAWSLVLRRVAPGLDSLYLTGVLISAQVLFTAVAWTVPRKPAQFWAVAAFAFPAFLILAFAPQDSPGGMQFRRGLLIPLSMVTTALLMYARVAAGLTRSGVWPGEVRLRLPLRLPGRRSTARARVSGLGSSSILRFLLVAWLTLVLVVYGYALISVRDSQPELLFSNRLLVMVGIGILPLLAIPVLAIWGLLGAGEPSGAFRTRLGTFKATLPLTSGALAADRLLTLLLGWLLVWVPLTVLTLAADLEAIGMEQHMIQSMQFLIARLACLSAFLVIGALPVLLWGRMEGFPNVLLTGVLAWALVWGISSIFPAQLEEPGKWRWAALIAALIFKLSLGCWALRKGVAAGHCTWRFGVTLFAVWVTLCLAIPLLFPVHATGGVWAIACLVLLVPFARPAFCPLAIAANRHR